MQGLLSPPDPRMAHVRSIDGQLLEVEAFSVRPLSAGDFVPERQAVRTTKDSTAVLELADGSLVELGERSQISVRARRQRTTIRVARGDVMVQAADQRDAELVVATEDLRVSVQGTIFAVMHGAKGSRVAVVEGRVEVESGRRRETLLPGDQFFTNLRLGHLPFGSAIDWSRESDRYFELLGDFLDLRQELSGVSLASELRHSTRLLDLSAADTVIYASFPNLGSSIEEVRAILARNLEKSSVLREWWEANAESGGLYAEAEEILDILQTVSAELGDEIVMTASLRGQSLSEPLVLTLLQDPSTFEDVLTAALERLAENANSGNLSVRFLVDPFVEVTGEDELLLWILDDLLAVAPSVGPLRSLAERLESGSDFVGSTLHGRVAQVYRDGAELVVGADVAALLAQMPGGESVEADAALAWSGVLDADTLVIESRTADGISQSGANLTFSQPRHGAMAWLAEPAPMGSLEFVSTDATAVSAFVFKDPLDIFDEILDLLSGLDSEAVAALREAESRLGIDLRNDLAAAIGGEITLALDGPVLPSPSWKLVVEVYNPGGLQSTIETLVLRLNEAMAQEEPGSEATLALSSESERGRTYYLLEASAEDGQPVEVHYLYDQGYLIAAPSRALLDRAVQTRTSHFTFLSSETLQDLMPVDGFLNFSGLVYQDVGSLLSPIAGAVAGVGAQLSPEQRQLVQEVAAETLSPSLYSFYGEQFEIRVVATTQSALLGGALDRLIGAGQLLGLSSVLGDAVLEGAVLEDRRDASAP